MSTTFCPTSPTGFHRFQTSGECRFCGKNREDLRAIRNAAASAAFNKCRDVIGRQYFKAGAK